MSMAREKVIASVEGDRVPWRYGGPLRRSALNPQMVAVAVCVAAVACGGRLAPIDGGALADSGLDATDAMSSADRTDTTDAADGQEPVPCDYDASDEVLCVPPAADQLVADPPSVSFPGGSYGTATFVAKGPWASDPTLTMYYLSSTLPVLNLPEVYTYGSPQTITILIDPKAAGQQGTLTMVARAGNVERTGQVTIDVTNCVPWPPSMVCGGENCGFQGDGCGGLLSCGMCPAQAPYCYLRKCVANMPTYCPTGQGLGMGGQCVPCAMTRTCLECPAGVQCVGIQDVCICENNFGGVPPHIQQ